jgi:hypothetical protein
MIQTDSPRTHPLLVLVALSDRATIARVKQQSSIDLLKCKCKCNTVHVANHTHNRRRVSSHHSTRSRKHKYYSSLLSLKKYKYPLMCVWPRIISFRVSLCSPRNDLVQHVHEYTRASVKSRTRGLRPVWLPDHRSWI